MKYEYTNLNGYQVPNLTVQSQPKQPLGKFGQMRLTFLQESKPFLFEKMLSQGTLFPSIRQMETEMWEQIHQTVDQLAEQQKEASPDRKTDPLGWTQWMNSLQAQAEELAMPMVYAL